MCDIALCSTLLISVTSRSVFIIPALLFKCASLTLNISTYVTEAVNLLASLWVKLSGLVQLYRRISLQLRKPYSEPHWKNLILYYETSYPCFIVEDGDSDGDGRKGKIIMLFTFLSSQYSISIRIRAASPTNRTNSPSELHILRSQCYPLPVYSTLWPTSIS